MTQPEKRCQQAAQEARDQMLEEIEMENEQPHVFSELFEEIMKPISPEQATHKRPSYVRLVATFFLVGITVLYAAVFIIDAWLTQLFLLVGH